MRTEAPRWTWYLPTKEYVVCKTSHRCVIKKVYRIREINTAYKTLEVFMHEQVAARKAYIRKELSEGNTDVGKEDVFSRLVLANESESEKLPLDVDELVRFEYIYLWC